MSFLRGLRFGLHGLLVLDVLGSGEAVPHEDGRDNLAHLEGWHKLLEVSQKANVLEGGSEVVQVS